jgi:hypothetical protein
MNSIGKNNSKGAFHVCVLYSRVQENQEDVRSTIRESSNCAPADQNKSSKHKKDMLYTWVELRIRESKDAVEYWYVSEVLD